MFKFNADTSKLAEGSWFNYQGSEILIAHLSNIKFQRTLAKLQQPFRKKLEAGTLDPKVQRDILAQAMSEAIVLDWKKVVDKDGVETPYTPKNALIALQNDPEFRDFVAECAANAAAFRDDEKEEVGNG